MFELLICLCMQFGIQNQRFTSRLGLESFNAYLSDVLKLPLVLFNHCFILNKPIVITCLLSAGNFYRIRSAFTYGARKLEQILLQPEDNIVGEICKFFSNTLDRHGSGQRPDVQDPVPMSSHNGFVPACSFSETVLGQLEKANSDLKPANSVGINGSCELDLDGLSQNGGNNCEVSGIEIKIGRPVNGHETGSMKVVTSTSSINCNLGRLVEAGAED